MPEGEFYRTQEVADLAGIHKDTLLRWLRKGWVEEPDRDLRNWRVFTTAEAKQIAAFAREMREPVTDGRPSRDPNQLDFIDDVD